MRQDPIVVVPYDPAWPWAFANARDLLEPLLGAHLARPIEHMGSTAVAGLAAKPIIDMLAVVHDADGARAAIPSLRHAGWVHAPEPSDENDRMLSFCTPSIERRSHHLHVVEDRSTPWRGWLAFRDYLRRHPDSATRYADLKCQLAAEHGHDPNDRTAYRAGKSAFVGDITTAALAEWDGIP